jgi:hypothetical protein
MAAGENTRLPTAGIPFPVKETGAAAPALLGSVNVAERAPVAVGVKTKPSVQE